MVYRRSLARRRHRKRLFHDNKYKYYGGDGNPFFYEEVPVTAHQPYGHDGNFNTSFDRHGSAISNDINLRGH